MWTVGDGVKLPRLGENVLLLPADVTNPHDLKTGSRTQSNTKPQDLDPHFYFGELLPAVLEFTLRTGSQIED